MGQSSQSMTIKTVHGNIKIKLFPDKAPNTVKRISELVAEGFYDGLTFHRVVDNFVVQGGDPTGTGMGGTGKKLKAEISDLKHEIGSLAMARAQDLDSADCQFYIVIGPAGHLDGAYTIFGQVEDGMDFVHQIKQGDKMVSVTLSE